MANEREIKAALNAYYTHAGGRDGMAAALAAAEQARWRQIETAPPGAGFYLVTNGSAIAVTDWSPEFGWTGFYGGMKPTHWMPLPAPRPRPGGLMSQWGGR